MPRSGCPFVSLALISAALSGCSPDRSVPQNAKGGVQSARQEFSEESKRAAQALSLSRNVTVERAEGEYARALLCTHGMNVLALRVQDAAGLADEQREAVTQAQAYFADQLQALGEGEGKGTEEIGSDLEKTADEHRDESESVRIAVSCLQALQDEA
ncbi:hypothetical protein [Pacificimonas flava]|uniref:hypothetical protein n=1 Tax=Pacificimonas flava TaxID=1234595 RepID=UPI000571DC56|nr:hypothetical protein [Pacificimonas flava]MBB5281779.1 hypothetical protein [Pacificimonas flava]